MIYELATPLTKELYPVNRAVGFIARPFNEEKVNKIKNSYNRKIVFIAIGGSNSGLDFEIDVSNINYNFITTPALKLKGNNVTYLPATVENTQDYIKASDFCIAKAGWGTVAELMLAGTPTALIERPNVPEDTMMIDELKHRDEIISVSVYELKNISTVLAKMESKIWKNTNYSNGYKQAADIICE